MLMNKIICLLVSILLLGTTTFAQEKAPKSKNLKTASPAAQAAAQQEQPKASKMKKDGTPDMRYSDNKKTKATEKPAGPLKKDGTPDMRHKANKDAAASKK